MGKEMTKKEIIEVIRDCAMAYELNARQLHAEDKISKKYAKKKSKMIKKQIMEYLKQLERKG